MNDISWEPCGTGLWLYIGLKVCTEVDWPKLCITRNISYISISVCRAWNSFLCVLINPSSWLSESRAMHGIPLGWFSYPCLRKGKILFFIISDLIVIFKLFLSSLPLTALALFTRAFFFISFFFHLLVFSLLFSDVFSKARERMFQAEWSVKPWPCCREPLVFHHPQGSEEQCYQHRKKEAFLRYSWIVSQKALKTNVKT